MSVEEYKPKTLQVCSDFESLGYKVSQKNGQNWVEINGKQCIINPWDTVWTVTHREQLNKEKQDNTAALKKRLKDLKENFAAACKKFDNDLKDLKIKRHKYVSFLINNHALSFFDLKGTAAFEEGKQLYEAKLDASAEENSSLAYLLGLNNSIQGECTRIRRSIS